MQILNKGPHEWVGTSEIQGDGTKGSRSIVIPVGTPTEIPDELGKRLIADFIGSPFFEFSEMAGESTDEQKRGPGRPAKANK